MKSPSSPPLQGCSAAVPFLWEEEPGKPKPSTALIPTACAAQLELPPRLLKQQPSPITKKRPKASSFRMSSTKRRKDHRSSSYGSLSFSPSPSPSLSHSPERPSSEQLHLGAIVLSSKRWKSKVKGWFYGGWRKLEMKGKARSEVAAGDSFAFPSDDEHKLEKGWNSSSLRKKMMTKITGSGSFALLSPSQTKSEFWATIYGGLKQVMPWKGKKTGFVN